MIPSASPPSSGLSPLEVQRQMIVILDFGSQYSELIARRIRETHVYSEILSYRTTAEQLRQLQPQGIILSGGPNSVYEPAAPVCDPEIWNLGIPVLGVCYGMQLMVQQLGGKVEAAQKGEYGRAALHILDPTDLLTNLPENSIMWMSHGDSVTELPPGFHTLASTDNTPLCRHCRSKASSLRGAISSGGGPLRGWRLSHPQLCLSHLRLRAHLDNGSFSGGSHSRGTCPCGQ